MKNSCPGIITLTGASGVGKSKITEKILELRPDIEFVLSLTSRERRPSDFRGEYLCGLQREELQQLSGVGKLVWLLPAHGNLYGTLVDSISSALSAPTPSFMILVPQTIPLLRTFAENRGRVSSFYIRAPNKERLRARLEARGDNPEVVAKRIQDCQSWDQEAETLNPPYIFISNQEPAVGIEMAARKILEYMEQH